MLLEKVPEMLGMPFLQMSQLHHYKTLHNPWVTLFLVMSGESS
jgi:hypothetical protein